MPARKNAQTKANETKAANAKNNKAQAPIETEAKPAELTISARQQRAIDAQAHIKAGADKSNVRGTTSVRVSVGVARYAAKHAPDANRAARISSLPSGTQNFYAANVKAYGDKPFSAAQLDNAKLARCINSGLISVASGGETITDGGVKYLVNKSGEALTLKNVLSD